VSVSRTRRSRASSGHLPDAWLFGEGRVVFGRRSRVAEPEQRKGLVRVFLAGIGIEAQTRQAFLTRSDLPRQLLDLCHSRGGEGP
jgi:hypothetical protein